MAKRNLNVKEKKRSFKGGKGPSKFSKSRDTNQTSNKNISLKNKKLMNVKVFKSRPNNKREMFANKKRDRKIKEKTKNLKKQEEEIVEIENENALFYGDKYEGDVEVNEDDWNLNSQSNGMVNLSEVLFKKMNEVEEKKLDPRIVETFSVLGDILHNYTSGKLPKAFNILPVTEDWEDIIEITNPSNWSPPAMYEATVMFCSNLNASLAEKFYSKVLLPVIRQDIKKNKKLNIHYYNCLKKAIFKPSGFFKGIIIPLSDSTSAKEAAIFGSIIKKCSIPVAHSAACIMKLIEKCQTKISMGALFFSKMLLLKKYALPNPVKESLVNFFVKFYDNKTPLPVLWHQTLLIFAQIYKLDLTEEEKTKLRNLVNKQNHHQITDEILRELNYKAPQFNFVQSTMVVD